MPKGFHHSEETRNKLSKQRKGIKILKHIIAKWTGPNNHNWKGKNAGYDAMHDRMRRYYGIPEKCEFCGITRNYSLKVNNIYWANVTGDYSSHDRKHWKTLCSKCNQKYDRERRKHICKSCGSEVLCRREDYIVYGLKK